MTPDFHPVRHSEASSRARAVSTGPARAALLCAALVPAALIATAVVHPAPLDAQALEQPTLEPGVVGTALGLRQLQGIKRVLVIGAHPDDEDTALLTALARGQGAETAYLSLTRGDGGQNLIGPELSEGLGVVRTGELLAARELDGGRQYFTRAFDYGFSKSADEALRLWPSDELLRDVVWVVRSFRPQVIVSIFTGTEADGHGQHQAAGIVAAEAFEAAGDPARFPETAEAGVAPWTPARFYRLAWRTPGEATTHVETGAFDPVLGRSHFQLAMESRSQHRSQDMGAAQPPGPRRTGLVHVTDGTASASDGTGFWEGIDTTLAGAARDLPDDVRARVVADLDAYRASVSRATAEVSALAPSAVVPDLLRAREHLAGALATLGEAPDGAEPDVAVRHGGDRANLVAELAAKRTRLDETVLAAAGVVVRARVAADLVVPGDTVDANVEVWNGGPYLLRHVSPALLPPDGWTVTRFEPDEGEAGRGPFGVTSEVDVPDLSGDVRPGRLVRWNVQMLVPDDAPPSRLYFLADARDGEMYRWPDDSALWGLPKNPPPLGARVSLALPLAATGGPSVSGSSDDPARTEDADHAESTSAQSAEEPAVDEPGGAASVRVTVAREARYVDVDKALGEFSRPVLVVPPVAVSISPGVVAWPTGLDEARDFTVELGAEAAVGGTLEVEAPDGWRVEPDAVPFRFDGPGQRRNVTFSVTPAGAAEGRHELRAVATLDDGRSYNEGYRLIEYPHIERTAMFEPAVSRISRGPLQVAEGIRVGYVMGSGDDGVDALRQMGVAVETVSPERIRAGDFTGYDVLVLGIRVYETRPDVAAANDALLDFARAGGTVVVQYNKQEYPAGGFAPYPVEMGRRAPRVTDEGSPVEFVDPESPVLNWPNRIEPGDFDGWVQERGLYFLSEWDERFRPQLAFTDPGEAPALGSLVVAPVGEGVYVYTGISFFRQFPAGVMGAYRLFANLVSLDGERWRGHLERVEAAPAGASGDAAGGWDR